MQGVTRDAPFFWYRILGFLALPVEANISKPESKIPFPATLWAGSDVVRSHLQRDGPDGALLTHRCVERSCEWDVHLRRWQRLQPPGPQCCGGEKVESPSTQRRPELCWGYLNDLHFFDRQAPREHGGWWGIRAIPARRPQDFGI